VTTMAKVQIKNLKSVLGSIETAFTESLRKTELYESIGDFAVKRIQRETRSGRDLSRDGQPIQDTAESTKNIKELIASGKIKMNPSKPRFFRPQVSQVTQTGELLDSLDYKFIRSSRELEISPTGSRKKTSYTWRKSGEKVKFLSDDHIDSNKGLAKDLAKRGFTFLGIDNKGIRRIRKLVLDEIRRIIKGLNG